MKLIGTLSGEIQSWRDCKRSQAGTHVIKVSVRGSKSPLFRSGSYFDLVEAFLARGLPRSALVMKNPVLKNFNKNFNKIWQRVKILTRIDQNITGNRVCDEVYHTTWKVQLIPSHMSYQPPKSDKSPLLYENFNTKTRVVKIPKNKVRT